MKDNQAKYPQLRFKGFTDPWEERRLGERFAERVDRSGDGEMLSVTIANGVVLANSLDRKDNSSSDKSNYKVVKKDDIAYNSMRMWQAASGVSKYDGIVSPAYTVLVPANGESSTFFGYQFKQTEMKQIFQRNSQGLTSDTWNLKYPLLSRIKTSAPERTEQIKIGEFLTKLDNLIAVNQRKLAKLKELKQGYLQKMFPQNGSKFPQLRFTGFAGAWEERKLGDEVRIVMGQSPNSENYTDDPNDYILVQGNADMKNGRVFPRVWTTQVTKQAEKDDLILSVRAPVGDIGKTAYDVVIGRGVAAIKGNEFIFQNLGKMKSDGYWTRYSTGSTFESINSTDIKEAIISVPAIEEQNKIGSFFKQLDNTIALHQRKLEKLQELKKGYLQKMFC